MEESYSKLNSTHKIVVTMLLQLVTECAGLVLATQPCTLASTTGSGYTLSVPAGTGYTVLYTCFNLPVTKSTNRVLATQSLLYSASPQQKKKKKLAKGSPVAL